MAPERVIATHTRIGAVVGPGPSELRAELELEAKVDAHRDAGVRLIVAQSAGGRVELEA